MQSKLLDEALDIATANMTPNAEGAALLQSWLIDPANERNPDKPRVQAAVHRHYQQRPGGDLPAAHRDVFAIAPAGKPLTTRGQRGEV